MVYVCMYACVHTLLVTHKYHYGFFIISVPVENVASISSSATVLEGVSRSRNALLNGNTRDYDWDSGYTCHQLGSGSIVVQLAQPYIIGSMRCVCMFVYLCVSMYIYLCLCMRLCVCLPIYRSICLSLCLSVWYVCCVTYVIYQVIVVGLWWENLHFLHWCFHWSENMGKGCWQNEAKLQVN